ncbi:MAG: hypothetical protein DMG30_23340, partial [Acidobacteria bacterium]
MTFDVTGLLIFLLAIVPGILTQQSRYLIVPRSLEKKSAVEETGEYVINSIIIHVLFLTLFWIVLSVGRPALSLGLSEAFQQKRIREWLWSQPYQPYLSVSYFLASLIGGYLFGFVRGFLALNQPVRNALG